MKRNTGLRGYRAKQAQEKAQQRQYNKHRHIKLTPDVQSLIAENIKHEWKPRSDTSVDLEVKGFAWSVRPLSTALFSKIKPLAAIFTLIFAIGNPTKDAPGSSDTRGQIIGRISIDERPSIVDKKVRLGDWEADTVMAKVIKAFSDISRTRQ